MVRGKMVLSCSRPRKFADGFVSANKRTYITNATFLRWRSIARVVILFQGSKASLAMIQLVKR